MKKYGPRRDPGFVVFAGVFEKKRLQKMDFSWTSCGEMCGKRGWRMSHFGLRDFVQFFGIYFARRAG